MVSSQKFNLAVFNHILVFPPDFWSTPCGTTVRVLFCSQDHLQFFQYSNFPFETQPCGIWSHLSSLSWFWFTFFGWVWYHHPRSIFCPVGGGGTQIWRYTGMCRCNNWLFHKKSLHMGLLALTEPSSSTYLYWNPDLSRFAASQLGLAASQLVVLSVGFRSQRELGKF